MIFRAAIAALVLTFSGGAATAFDLQGHRGARGLMPENTLPGFAGALSVGVTTLELDVGLTSDGVLVVSHDPALNPDLTRTKDGRWINAPVLIKSTSMKELKSYDVGRLKQGSKTAERFPDQLSVDGTSLPTLSEVFDLAERATNTMVRFNIETKINPTKPATTATPQAFAAALHQLIASRNLQSRVTVQSFDWRSLQEIQRLDPSIQTVYLTAEQDWLNNVADDENGPSPWAAGFKLSDFQGSVPAMIKAAGGGVWSPFHRDLTPTRIKAAQDIGLKVIPWTVNDPADMRRLIQVGVDGIITDYPDRLRTVMEEAGLSIPKPTPIEP
ncbi:MAG: glycerophosphodiester phosphodiesterase [Pseudomonadota bacterium]